MHGKHARGSNITSLVFYFFQKRETLYRNTQAHVCSQETNRSWKIHLNTHSFTHPHTYTHTTFSLEVNLALHWQTIDSEAFFQSPQTCHMPTLTFSMLIYYTETSTEVCTCWNCTLHLIFWQPVTAEPYFIFFNTLPMYNAPPCRIYQHWEKNKILWVLHCPNMQNVSMHMNTDRLSKQTQPYVCKHTNIHPRHIFIFLDKKLLWL